jgi:hypothetical protein
MQQMCEHLQLLGYKTEPDAIGVAISHEGQAHFRLFQNIGGIGFIYSFNVTQEAPAKDPGGFFGLLNEINQGCVVSRFAYDSERNKLYVSAWYPDYYDRESFGLFFDRLRTELAMPLFKFPEGYVNTLRRSYVNGPCFSLVLFHGSPGLDASNMARLQTPGAASPS